MNWGDIMEFVEMTDILIKLVTNVGFPIAVSAYLLHQNRQIQLEHQKEVQNLGNLIESNTIALTKLCDRLDGANK